MNGGRGRPSAGSVGDGAGAPCSGARRRECWVLGPPDGRFGDTAGSGAADRTDFGLIGDVGNRKLLATNTTGGSWEKRRDNCRGDVGR